MTQQEVLAARLTKIWCPETLTWSAFDWVIKGELSQGIAYESRLDVKHGIGLRAHIAVSPTCYNISLFLSSGVTEECGGICVWFGWGEEMDISEEIESSSKSARQLADYHLPFFRRNCWLSGVPIEATNHEKAEWIQNLSCEEIEAWNLNF